MSRVLSFFFRGRRSLVSGPFVFLLGLGGFVGAKAWWYHGYSRGSRTGVVRKISGKGPPSCKYARVEMVMNGGPAGSAPEIWEFSLDDNRPESPVLARIKSAERG